MSGEAIDWAARQCPPGNTKFTLNRLAAYANDAGLVWISIERLRLEVGKSERMTQYDLRRLEQCGFISVTGERKYWGVGRKLPIYRLMLEKSPMQALPQGRRRARPAPALKDEIPAVDRRPGAIGCTPPEARTAEAGCTAWGAMDCTSIGEGKGKHEKDSLCEDDCFHLWTELVADWTAALPVTADFPKENERAAIATLTAHPGLTLRAMVGALRQYLSKSRASGRPPRYLAKVILEVIAWQDILAEPKTPDASRTTFAIAFQGPPGLVEALLAEHPAARLTDREAWLRSYLGEATWDGETRTLTQSRSYAHKVLCADWVQDVFRRFNVRLGH